MKITIKDIAANGIIAALYVVLTLITYPFSFQGIQIRISEALVLLCFFRKDYSIGLSVGCALSNLFSTIGIVDVAFGTMATMIACLGIMFCKHLCVACIFPIVSNSLIVALELNLFVDNSPFWINAGLVAIGETIAIALGYIFFMVLKSRKNCLKLIRAKQNLDFKL
ncbi:MAG: QueT transporter family protein [Bacilli bacterium]|nr:QueT transporter family protein [Bacilli bacterium]